MRSGKPPSFPFYPQDFLSSHAVQRMSPAALGGYIKLICNAWLSDEPGTLPNDDETLKCLSGLNGSWDECKPEIMRAFVVRGESITQPKMQEIREAQKRRFDQACLGASVTNELRRIANAQRTPTLRESVRIAVTPSSSSSRESKDTGRCAPDPSFSESWQIYPNRKGKAQSLKVWAKLSAEDRALVPPAIEAQKLWSEWSDPQYIPRFSTWLNQRRWEDEPTQPTQAGGFQWKD